MRFKELPFWVLFLAICFSLGYLKGLFPEFQLQSFFLKHDQITLLTTDKRLISPQFLQSWTLETATQLNIEEDKNWNSFTQKLIPNPGSYLILVPSTWIPQLVQEGLVQNINYLDSYLSKRIAPDFIMRHDEKIFSVPLLWAFQLVHLSKTNKNPIYLYPNEDTLIWRWKTAMQNQLQVKISDQLPGPLPMGDKSSDYFTTDLNSEQTKADLQNPTFPPAILYYALLIPRNSPHRPTSIHLIRKILDTDLGVQMVTGLPFASTLQRADTGPTPRIQKPSQFRNSSLTHMTEAPKASREQIDEAKEILN